MPEQERLVGPGFRGRQRQLLLSPGRQACKHLAVPFPANTPLDLPISAHDFPTDMVCGAFAPAAGLVVHEADFAGGVVLDLHGAVVVDGRIAGDDADDGGSNFPPAVGFGRAGGGERV